MEIYLFLLITGSVFFVWLLVLVRQTQREFASAKKKKRGGDENGSLVNTER